MILIGSRAIKYHFPDFKLNEDSDMDYVVSDKWEYTKGYENNIKCEYLKNSIIYNLYGYGSHIISADDLCTLKASHLVYDINWLKHMYHLQFLLDKGCKINPKLFWELYKYWEGVHGKNKRSDLKMSKEDFFNNAINYDSGEHDELHKIINPIPIYTLCLKDGCEVELDPEKWSKLSHEQKLEFVREEVYIMAFERYKHLNYADAYFKMLKKFIINHAPDFSLIWILENYKELVRKPKYNFINKIKNELQPV